MKNILNLVCALLLAASLGFAGAGMQCCPDDCCHGGQCCHQTK